MFCSCLGSPIKKRDRERETILNCILVIFRKSHFKKSWETILNCILFMSFGGTTWWTWLIFEGLKMTWPWLRDLDNTLYHLQTIFKSKLLMLQGIILYSSPKNFFFFSMKGNICFFFNLRPGCCCYVVAKSCLTLCDPMDCTS